MNKLFIIADDLTGALDTGVCFASAGIKTCVRLPGDTAEETESETYRVEVAIVESRHMQPEDAYCAVHDIVSCASHKDYTYFYKKTDSALRGNIGAELSATLCAAKGKTIHFIPAYPKMNRVSRDGILYINGDTPVAQSVFAQDPFNPVRHSGIREIIAEQTQTHAYLAQAGATEYPEGIAVYNAETDEQVEQIGRHLVHEIGANLFAGCAGFANVLPQMIDLGVTKGEERLPSGKIIVFCGSVNPISLNQCACAERSGFPFYHLQNEGMFHDLSDVAALMIVSAQSNDICMLDTGAGELDATDEDVLAQSTVVAAKMSEVMATVLRSQPASIPCIIGGDTLLAFAKDQGISSLIPIKEMMPGVVLSRYQHGGEWRYLITKSGGFGTKDLFYKLYQELNKPTDNTRG